MVITVVAERKENTKIQPKGVYYIATFSYKMADPDKSKELKQYAQDFKIFRQETLTDVAHIKTAMHYYNALANGEGPELAAGVPTRELNEAVEDHYQQNQE